VECFDAVAAKAYLKRSRVEFIIWLVAFATFTATAVSLFAIYGSNPSADRTLFLWLALSFIAVDMGGLAGSVFSILRYVKAERAIIDSGAYIREVSSRRAEVVALQLQMDADNVVFEAQGYYFSDIDTPFQMRAIGENIYSSNYQVSVITKDSNHLNYKSVVFSLLGQEERVFHGSIPLDRISSIGVIKANGIDLFCSQLKIVFGSQCMLFALDPGVDYHDGLERLNAAVRR